MQKLITLKFDDEDDNDLFTGADIRFNGWQDEVKMRTNSRDEILTACFQLIVDHETELVRTELIGVPVLYGSQQPIEVDGNAMLRPSFDFSPFNLTYDQCKYIQRFADVHGLTPQEAIASMFKYHAKCAELNMQMVELKPNPAQETLKV